MMNSTFKRYNIIDEDMQLAALEKAHEFQKREIENRRTLLMKKAV